MKAKIIYSHLTPEEKAGYIATRRKQGLRVAESLFPLMLICVLFGFLGRYDLYSITLFAVFATLCMRKIPNLIQEIRSENKKLLSASVFARGQGVNPVQVEL